MTVTNNDTTMIQRVRNDCLGARALQLRRWVSNSSPKNISAARPPRPRAKLPAGARNLGPTFCSSRPSATPARPAGGGHHPGRATAPPRSRPRAGVWRGAIAANSSSSSPLSWPATVTESVCRQSRRLGFDQLSASARRFAWRPRSVANGFLDELAVRLSSGRRCRAPRRHGHQRLGRSGCEFPATRCAARA